MSFGEDDGGSEVELETLHGGTWPTVTQFSVFLENRVGQLLEVVRSFQGTKVKIIGLTISDSADCSILRLILSYPEQGREILALNKLAFAENELVAVELPNSPHGAGRALQGASPGRDQHPLRLSPHPPSAGAFGGRHAHR